MLLEIFFLSIVVGIFVGLTGIGAGALLLPILIFYNFTLEQSVAISLFINAVPNTLPGLYLYYKEGHFDLQSALILSFGTVIGSTLGAYLALYYFIDKKIVYRIYTALLFLLAFYMLYFYC